MPTTTNLVGFEVFPRAAKYAARDRIGVTVSQSERGLNISPTAFDALGKPNAVVLYFDRDDCRIALRASDDDAHRYAVSRSNRAISCVEFIRWTNAKPGFYPGAISDGMLICAIERKESPDADAR